MGCSEVICEGCARKSGVQGRVLSLKGPSHPAPQSVGRLKRGRERGLLCSLAALRIPACSVPPLRQPLPSACQANSPRIRTTASSRGEGVKPWKGRALRTSCYSPENGVRKHRREAAPGTEKVHEGLGLRRDDPGLADAL